MGLRMTSTSSLPQPTTTQEPESKLHFFSFLSFKHSMSEHFVGNASASSSTSSWNSSSHDTEDDHAIAKILDEEENSKNGNRLGRRLSHLDSIPILPPPGQCSTFVLKIHYIS
ncbi:hypothetical protein M9H77_29414 [Catharanthus roseus]|uniref:Uncharacterized protein n=1 Tax=Catharanthus roseus TaxID=4058 RepID=A0ACB9ZUB4_CATRO|nr:hypothetical protein M9H77_29414 [Catharanthus roseus]